MPWFGREKRTPEEVEWKRIHDQVRVGKQHRLAQTTTQRDLVDAISAALFEADPVGLNFRTNTDEYDAEAETIVIALPRAAGPDDVKALTQETFVQWFGADTAGPEERYVDVAQAIWSLWRSRQGLSGKQV